MKTLQLGCGGKARGWLQALGREGLPPAVVQGPNQGQNRIWTNCCGLRVSAETTSGSGALVMRVRRRDCVSIHL